MSEVTDSRDRDVPMPEPRAGPKKAVFVGTVLEYRAMGQSGCGELVIGIESGPAVYDDSWVYRQGDNLIVTGDWRPIRDLVETLREMQVVVQPGAGEGGSPLIRQALSQEEEWNPEE